MTQNNLERLINRYIDRVATPQEVASISELLRDDKSARRMFMEHLNLDSAIARVAAGELGQAAAVQDLLTLHPHGKVNKHIAYSASGIACVLLLAIGMLWHYVRAMNYATVVYSVGSDQFTDGAPLHGADYRMDAGTLEVITTHGARVVIEAPAKFRFESPQKLHLAQGRISAEVPTSAKGFTVITPSGDAVDLGTKFAVDVSSQFESEVHVFQGEVIARAKGSKQRQLLTANNAIRFHNFAKAEACDVRQGSFVGLDEVSPLAAGLRVGQRLRAAQASERLKQDPALLAWFDFDSPPGPDGRVDDGPLSPGKIGLTCRHSMALSNLASDYNHTSVRNVAVHGARWVQGRFPGTGALDFVNSEDCVQLDLNARIPQFTLMTWVRLNQVEGRCNSLYSTDEWGELGQVHWMIGLEANIRFAIKGPTPNARGNSNIFLETKPQAITELERWVQLTLVYDSIAGQAQHYLNGQVLAVTEMPQGLHASLGPAQLGNWKPQEEKANQPRRRLSGRMDEFAAFSRPFSEKEVRDYFEASKPYQ